MGGGQEKLARLVWDLHGTVRNFVTVSPPAVILGSRSIRAGTFPPESVHLTFHVPVREVSAESRSPRATMTVSPRGEGAWELTVAPAGFPLGSIDFDVMLHAIAADGGSLPAVSIAVSGQVTTDVEAAPNPMTLGVLDVGTLVDEQVDLRSRTGSRFRVEHVECESEHTQIQPNDPKTEDTLQYRVVQQISQGGFHKSEVRFSILHEDEYRETITLPVRYVGR